MESDHYVVLWSHSQQIVHTQTAADMLTTNRGMALDNQPNDFVVLDFAETREAANQLTKIWQDRRDARAKF